MRGVEVQFGDDVVLRNITMQVERGERFAMIGPSGAGKTTLLRAVAGFVSPRSGEIKVDGRDVIALPPEQRDAVYMHQTPVLFPHLTVFENVAFPLRVRRTPHAEVSERAGLALEAMQMGEYADRLPRTLSGGQRHRVALARAIVGRPPLLLLDEPFSALDPALKRDVRAALLAAHSQYDPGLIVVTHDFDDAAGIADRIAVLIAGEIAQVAAPSALFARPASLDVARFLNIANEVQGRSDGAGYFSSPLGGLKVAGDVPAGPAVAAFGPAAVRIGLDAGIAARVVEVRVHVDHTTLILSTSAGTIEAACPTGGAYGVGIDTLIALDAAKAVVFSTGGRTD